MEKAVIVKSKMWLFLYTIEENKTQSYEVIAVLHRSDIFYL